MHKGILCLGLLGLVGCVPYNSNVYPYVVGYNTRNDLNCKRIQISSNRTTETCYPTNKPTATSPIVLNPEAQSVNEANFRENTEVVGSIRSDDNRYREVLDKLKQEQDIRDSEERSVQYRSNRKQADMLTSNAPALPPSRPPIGPPIPIKVPDVVDTPNPVPPAIKPPPLLNRPNELPSLRQINPQGLTY